VRDFLNDLITRASTERSLYLFFGLHLLGLHGLAGAKTWRLKLPAGFCLLASIPCLVKGLRLTPSMLGANAVTGSLLGELAILGGVWLIVGGRTYRDWLIGFAICGFGAAVVLFAAGHRIAAAACTTLIVPMLGVVLCHGNRPESTDAKVGGWLEGNLTWAALLAASFALVTSLIAWPPGPLRVHEARPRLRDFITQPSSLLLLTAGAAFSVGVAMRVWPPTAKKPV